uniref:Uncharacterized protein n=1 Tax=Arundo donax TaxID=35708 RepID=A0A0A9HRI6_ARUDO
MIDCFGKDMCIGHVSRSLSNVYLVHFLIIFSTIIMITDLDASLPHFVMRYCLHVLLMG